MTLSYTLWKSGVVWEVLVDGCEFRTMNSGESSAMSRKLWVFRLKGRLMGSFMIFISLPSRGSNSSSESR